jgi:2-keto-4-pentenoate hydratase
MVSNSHFSQAATELLNRRVANTKLPSLEENIRPQSIEDALAIQTEMMMQRTDSIGGWKCLLPPAETQLVVAPIFANTINQGATCRLFADNGVARIEPEIAFVLGQDLPARKQDYTPADIDNALSSCHMALELMQDRFQVNSGVKFPEKLADCLVNQGLYLGPQIERSLAYKASEIKINVSQADQYQNFSGKHPNQLPQLPLYWLINFMSKRGIDFTAGQAIITGSYAGIVEVLFDCQTEIEYVGLGKYSVEFKTLV